MGLGPKLSRSAIPAGTPVRLSNGALGTADGQHHRTQRRITPPAPPNPNPLRFQVIEHVERNGFLLVEIQYDDCTNYEGRKLLLFKDVSFTALMNQAVRVGIDPHFSDEAAHHYPCARFEPTDFGRALAWRACS